MASRKFTVGRGERVSVGLVGRPISHDRGHRRSHPPLAPNDQTEETYAFFKKGVKVYDLGYALDPISGHFTEIVIDHIADAASFLNVDWRSSYVGSVNATLLAGGIALKREAIPYESEMLYTDVVTTAGGVETRSILGKKNTRPRVPDLNTPGAPLVTDEGVWQPQAFLKLKSVNALRVESLGYYSNFDTADSSYKITEEPDPGAGSVTPALSNLKAIYLVPQILKGIYLTPTTPLDEEAYNNTPGLGGILMTRLPLVTPPLSLTYTPQGLSPSRIKGVASPDASTTLNAAVAPYHLSTGGGSLAFIMSQASLYLPSGFFVGGALRGILQTSGKTYYVWLQGAISQPYDAVLYTQ